MKGPPIPAIISRLRKEIKALRPDIVHLHSSFAGFLGRLSTLFSVGSARFFIARIASRLCVPMYRRPGSSPLPGWNCSPRSSNAPMSAVLPANARPCDAIFTSRSFWSRTPSTRRRGYRRRSRDGAAPDGYEAHHHRGRHQAAKEPTLFTRIARSFERKEIEFTWIGDGDEKLKQELVAAGVNVTGWLSRVDALLTTARRRPISFYVCVGRNAGVSH